MTVLLQCRNLCKKLGARELFSELTFGVFKGDRLGIIGPNGSGKSTLLKVIAGEMPPSDGEVISSEGVRVAYVGQDSLFPDRPLLSLLKERLQKYGRVSDDEATLESQVQLSKLGFEDHEASGSTLSGGWKKRFDIALALVIHPDILLLDEPTNHLDLEGVLWLEQFLRRQTISYIVVSHDRAFLQNTCQRVMEVNKAFPKGFFSVDGSYEVFIEKRIDFLETQINTQKTLKSKLRTELEWMKRSPKARTTKSRSRVADVLALQKEHEKLKQRNTLKISHIDFQASERQTKRLLVGKNLGKSYGDKNIFSNLDILFSPGTRIGIVGANGSGKSTLLNIIAGNIPFDSGTLKLADDLQVVYFDQHREQLPANTTLGEALSPSGDFVNYRGHRIHVNGWCQKFLFSPDNLRLPIGQLSGGERARILIARLMLKPADLLLLDEPTNDLDIPTLELLQDCLLDFSGAVALITHDRYFMNQVATQILAITPSGGNIYADYTQWEQAKKQTSSVKESKSVHVEKKKQRRLTYKEKQEFEGMENKINHLENEIEVLNQEVLLPETQNNSDKLRKLCAFLEEKTKELDNLYLRWEELASYEH